MPTEGMPKIPWRVNIKQQGILKPPTTFPKLERMGLIATEESCVGSTHDSKTGKGWKKMFVSQCTFWQIDARIFLFTLSPAHFSPYPGGTPFPSRPVSQVGTPAISPKDEKQAIWGGNAPGPFASNSHLPTYYPPPPPQYTFTGPIRHPIRPKPPAQGATFYQRYIPSVDSYISFRTASLSDQPPAYSGPSSNSSTYVPPKSGISPAALAMTAITTTPSDLDLLVDWMNQPRVSAMWGCQGPKEKQEEFLKARLDDKHSFPIIGTWNGKPFGYFEIYWVKEDKLGRYVTGRESSHYDRGIHALVGEQSLRGAHRAKIWISALVHYCWLADFRTQRVLLEPRVDNEK